MSVQGERAMPQKIPEAIIERLPVYQRHLTELAYRGIEKISSVELATKVGITDVQIRKDLNWFGSLGLKGYGYRVEELLHQINQILGLSDTITMVLIGGGNLGRALINYPGFQDEHFMIKAVFDSNLTVINNNVNGLTVYPITFLKDYLKQNSIRIGIIATLMHGIQEVVDVLIDGGVQGIWNFVPENIKVPSFITVENVNIIESLMILSYKCKSRYPRLEKTGIRKIKERIDQPS